MDWWMDLLTTCIHHLELHFTVHWHTQTSVLGLLQPPLSVSGQRFLPKEILQLPALRSLCHSCPCRTLCQLATQLTRSKAGGHFTPTSLSSLHRVPSNWQLTTELSHSPTTYCTSLHSTELLKNDSGSQNQSYFRTGGLLPISSSWHQTPWDSGP
jgi:hypothetical protein